MPLLTEQEVLAKARQRSLTMKKSLTAMLHEEIGSQNKFDVFSSHSSDEPPELLLGVKSFLEEQDLTVYVDQYGDPQLSPEHVTVFTANLLRTRLQTSRSLLYIHSRHSKKSRWMPWELGFMDGCGRPLAILPVTETLQQEFHGEEYLGLYPYVDRATKVDGAGPFFWANDQIRPDTWALFSKWVDGTPVMPRSEWLASS